MEGVKNMLATGINTQADAVSASALRAAPAPPRAADAAPRAAAVEPKSSPAEEVVDPQALVEAVEQLQATAGLVDTGLQFKIDDSSGKVQIIVTNKDTNEVIREIPPSDTIRLAQKIRDVLGLILDTVA
jgi:flagellar protein FlaG